MFRIAANVVKKLILVDRELPKPAVVGVAHHSDASRPLAVQLVRRLRQLGEHPCVAGDDERWKAEGGIPHRLLFEKDVFIGSKGVEELLTEWASLVEKGCNFVIASTVTAELEKDFMHIRSKKPRGADGFISTVQVMMRMNIIQSYSMNAVGVEPADFVISPDVTSFDISEFTRADEMAVVGERTTNESVRRLKAMLTKLDPKLFS